MTKETPEQEAERLYPYHTQNDVMYTDSMVTNIQRSAHITAARMYMGEVERLRKVLEKSLEWIADIKQKDIPLDDKKGMALYHIKWLATEALKTNTHGKAGD